MMSAQKNGDANATPQREEKRTETTAQREELQYESIVTLRLLNGRRHNDKYVSVRQVSCHIQYTYNSSHKINLFSFKFEINNYKKSDIQIRK